MAVTVYPHATRTTRRTALRRVRRRWIRPGDADRGSAPLELAIVAPAILLLVLGILQACLVFHARSLALAAAQQGADAARSYNAPSGAGPARAEAFLTQAAGDSLTGVDVSVTADGGRVRVTVQGTAISLLPGLAFHISQTSTGPREQVSTP